MYSIAHNMKRDNEEVDELVSEMWADDNVRTCENQYFQKACRWAVWRFREKMRPFPAFSQSASLRSGSLIYYRVAHRGSSMSPTYMEAERNDFYEFALTLVDGDKKDVLIRRLDGYTNKEIAEELGISQATASDRYRRCLRLIKKKTT
jgi:RNA polymerase sigma factor (sigma-70 family)